MWAEYPVARTSNSTRDDTILTNEELEEAWSGGLWLGAFGHQIAMLVVCPVCCTACFTAAVLLVVLGWAAGGHG